MLGTRVVKTGFTEEGAWSLQKDHELGTGRPREKGINTKVSEPEALSGRLGAEPEQVQAGKLRYGPGKVKESKSQLLLNAELETLNFILQVPGSLRNALTCGSSGDIVIGCPGRVKEPKAGRLVWKQF